jgi:hypothetical protein
VGGFDDLDVSTRMKVQLKSLHAQYGFIDFKRIHSFA